MEYELEVGKLCFQKEGERPHRQVKLNEEFSLASEYEANIELVQINDTIIHAVNMSPLGNLWMKHNCHLNQISSRQTCFYAKLTAMDTDSSAGPLSSQQTAV